MTEKMNHKRKLLFIAAILLVWMLLNAIATCFVIMNIEYKKVGWKANYDILQEMQLKQINEFVKQYKENPEPQKPGDTTGKTDTATAPVTVLSPEQITSVKKDFSLQGSVDAKITIVEYSDFECPFCIKLFKSSAIQNVLAANEGKVNYMFKHFPLPMHPNANKQHEAAECVREIGGDESYFAIKSSIFSKAQGNNSFDLNALNTIVKDELKLDEGKFKECLDSGKYAAKITASTEEWNTLFGIDGTPGTVIINNTTGKYEVISGAQGQATFEAAIKKIME